MLYLCLLLWLSSVIVTVAFFCSKFVDVFFGFLHFCIRCELFQMMKLAQFAKLQLEMLGLFKSVSIHVDIQRGTVLCGDVTNANV